MNVQENLLISQVSVFLVHLVWANMNEQEFILFAISVSRQYLSSNTLLENCMVLHGMEWNVVVAVSLRRCVVCRRGIVLRIRVIVQNIDHRIEQNRTE